MDIKSKREKEKELVSFMIELYCKKKHKSKTLCPECKELDAYARSRVDNCPFMETEEEITELDIDSMVVKVAGQAIVIVSNYFLSKLFIFKK